MKRVRVIILFLLLGAIVNVAVAWGCAIFVDFSTFSQLGLNQYSGPGLTSETGACWALSREDYLGSTFLTGRAILEDDRRNAQLMGLYSSVRVDVPQVPVWSQFAIPPIMRMRVIEGSRGWPFRTCLWIETITDTTSIRRHVWIVGESPNQIYLPLAPLWRGFLLNTIFYAGIMWLLIPGPFVIRRMIRRRRGLCVKCAYDLRGAEHEACPECGMVIMKSIFP